jgi:hypothetical protein
MLASWIPSSRDGLPTVTGISPGAGGVVRHDDDGHMRYRLGYSAALRAETTLAAAGYKVREVIRVLADHRDNGGNRTAALSALKAERVYGGSSGS